MNPKVDAYINRSEKWPNEMARLRPKILDGEGSRDRSRGVHD